ncbi:MAG: hypothetical protein RL322_2025 [Pseudomonadota bacterium]|jgi:hypothetical protein
MTDHRGWFERTRTMRSIASVIVVIGCLTGRAEPARAQGPAVPAVAQPGATEAQQTPRSIADPALCDGLAADNRNYRRRILGPMQDWAGRELAGLRGDTLLYPFSGPDAVTALALFPAVRHLTMLSLQKASLEQLAPADEETVAAECDIHRFFTQTGFFRTLDLDGKERAAAPRLLALLLLSLDTAGIRPTAIGAIEVDPNGSVRDDPARRILADDSGLFPPAPPPMHDDGTDPKALSGTVRGVRIEGLDGQGQPRLIDYLSIDLSNAGIRRHSGGRRMIEDRAREAVMIKSGSHLLQSRNFSNLARIIAHRASTLVQDETGLDIDWLTQFGRLEIHGRFTEPFEFWRDSESMARLRSALEFFHLSETPPFPYGYRKPSGTLILVATSDRTPPGPPAQR